MPINHIIDWKRNLANRIPVAEYNEMIKARIEIARLGLQQEAR